MILDLGLEHDLLVTDNFGSCTAFTDACPTDALLAPYQIDGSKCISYITIELKNEIRTDFQEKMNSWAFGCDVFQTVCPWNRFATSHSEPAFNPPPKLLSLSKNEWEEMTQEVFSVIFKNSAIKRTKYEGLKRNIKFLST